MTDAIKLSEPSINSLAPVWRSLRLAAPALAAFAAIRVLGLMALDAFAVHPHHWLTCCDAQWYRGIARNGYGLTRVADDGRLLTDYAFFPLYALLERAVASVTGLPLVDAGLAISAVASLVAAWGIFAVANLLYGQRVGLVVTVLWASLPVGIVQAMAYSESLFTALAAWTLYALLIGRWVTAGTLACLAGLTRPTGVAVAAAVMIPAALTLLHRSPAGPSVTRDRWRPPRAMVGAVLAPLGWVGYVAWVGYRTGSPLGYFHITRGWGNGFDGGLAFARWIWGFLTGTDFVLGLLVCAGVAVLLWALALCVRQRQPLPLIVFASVMVFLALTTAGYFGSKPRYLLPTFPLLLPLATWLAPRRLQALLPTLALLAAASTVFSANWLLAPGPP